MAFLYYIFGAVLLVLPVSFLRMKRKMTVGLGYMMDRPKLRYAWFHWINLVDFLRALVGAWLLEYSFRATGHEGDSIWSAASMGLVMVTGLFLQQVMYNRDEEVFPAPIAYVFGLSLMLFPTAPIIIAWVMAVSTAMVLRNLPALFVSGALSVALLGVFLQLPHTMVGITTAVMGLPAVVASMFCRSLELLVQKPTAVARSTETSLLRDIPVTVADRGEHRIK